MRTKDVKFIALVFTAAVGRICSNVCYKYSGIKNVVMYTFLSMILFIDAKTDCI